MAREKYTIFVSSTYEDLREERDQVMKAILELGHIPVGMEMFSAGDEQQWDLIRRTIDETDYYLVIIAHRYGSTDGVTSYTEKEYDYAVSKEVPILGFVIDDDARWPKSKMDTDAVAVDLLNKFKIKAKSRIINFWRNRDELNSKVTVALSKAFISHPRLGWVKAESSSGLEAVKELTRLSRENADLRKKINDLRQSEQLSSDTQDRRVVEILRANTIRLSFYYVGDNDWSNHKSLKYEDVFLLLAPELVIEKAASKISHHLGNMYDPLYAGKTKRLRENWPTPSNIVKRLLTDFHALGLVAPSAKRHHVKDTEEYWSLTEQGVKTLNRIRIAKLEAALSPTSPKAGGAT